MLSFDIMQNSLKYQQIIVFISDLSYFHRIHLILIESFVHSFFMLKYPSKILIFDY